MEHAAPKAVTAERVPAGGLVRVGVLAALLSASASALVVAIARSHFGPAAITLDEAVTMDHIMGASAAGAAGPEGVKRIVATGDLEEVVSHRITLSKGTARGEEANHG